MPRVFAEIRSFEYNLFAFEQHKYCVLYTCYMLNKRNQDVYKSYCPDNLILGMLERSQVMR